jgi:hypothetical protein
VQKYLSRLDFDPDSLSAYGRAFYDGNVIVVIFAEILGSSLARD